MTRLLRRLRGRVAAHLRERRLRADQPFTPITRLPAHRRPDPTSGSEEFDERRAFGWLEAQCAAGPRIPGSEGHQVVRDLIIRQLGQTADALAVQRWRQRVARGPGAGDALPMCNIFALFQGRSVAGASPGPPHLMLCAHWDTRPVADRDPDPARRGMPVLGANDGASGVAVLLEMSRLLALAPPPVPVLLAFWDGEDLGENFYGSTMFARHLHRREMSEWRPRRSILIDMVGKQDLRCATETASVRQAPVLWADVHAAVGAEGLERHFHGPRRRIGDDHIPLARAGIESVLLIDPEYGEWHTTHDTVERCSPASLGVIGRVLVRFVDDCRSIVASPR